MLFLWSVRTVCVWITGRKVSSCLTATSMCWEMRNRPVWRNCLWSGSMWRRFRWRVKSWRNTQDLPMYSSIPI